MRKIDRLSTALEEGLCEILILKIQLARDAEYFRQQVKTANDFNIVRLFRELCFNDTRNCTKEVYPEDLTRAFVVNSLLLEPHRLNFFYTRILKNNAFDLQMLQKLLTSARRCPIVDNISVKVDGKSREHRRTHHLIDENKNLTNSLTPGKRTRS